MKQLTHQLISFEETNSFQSLFLDYINQSKKVTSFYNLFPTIENFGPFIQQRTFPEKNREIIIEVLKKQYESLSMTPSVRKNLELLSKKNTFTITTGHQLNLATGPLYFIYKIITTIQLCKKLNSEFSSFHFVPIYWMASEDHDVAEINHFHLFGKKYTWETDQQGAVGRFDLNGIEKIWETNSEIPDFIKNIYTKNKTLSEATRELVDYLFGKEGLLILDPDDYQLKKLASSFFEKELTEQKSVELIQKTTSELEKQGYESQLHPREINLFYLKGTSRERITWEKEKFHINQTSLSFTKEEILNELKEHPEYFSPNAALRPVYQEIILPNIAYVGGPAEIAYWLQLKSIFDYYHISYPILIPRNFVLYISSLQEKKIKKLQLSFADLFLDKDQLKKQFIKKQDSNATDLSTEKKEIEKTMKDLSQKAISVDATLKGNIEAEYQKIKKIIEEIEKKILKAVERKEETKIQQLVQIKDKLFPEDSLQERYDNFLTFYINNSEFISQLMDLINPLDFRFNIIAEQE